MFNLLKNTNIQQKFAGTWSSLGPNPHQAGKSNILGKFSTPSGEPKKIQMVVKMMPLDTLLPLISLLTNKTLKMIISKQVWGRLDNVNKKNPI